MAQGGLLISIERQDDMIKATKREFQKIENICPEYEFGEYNELISDTND